MFKKEFKIDDISYVFKFDGVNISLYINANESNIKYLIDENSMDFWFGDEPAESHFEKINKPEVVFKVVKEAKKFIDDVLKKHKPYYFVYSANEPEKFSVYSKFANRIAAKYGYVCVVDKNIFRFYKNA